MKKHCFFSPRPFPTPPASTTNPPKLFLYGLPPESFLRTPHVVSAALCHSHLTAAGHSAPRGGARGWLEGGRVFLYPSLNLQVPYDDLYLFLYYQYLEDAVGYKRVRKASAPMMKSTYSLGYDDPDRTKAPHPLSVPGTNVSWKAAMRRGLLLLRVSVLKGEG